MSRMKRDLVVLVSVTAAFGLLLSLSLVMAETHEQAREAQTREETIDQLGRDLADLAKAICAINGGALQPILDDDGKPVDVVCHIPAEAAR